MWKLALVLLFLAFMGHGRRVLRWPQEGGDSLVLDSGLSLKSRTRVGAQGTLGPLDACAQLLRAFSPSAAFTAASRGQQLSRSISPVLNPAALRVRFCVQASTDIPAVPDTPTVPEFVCDNCGYTIFPAFGDKQKVFHDDFRCPSCRSTKDHFFDATDLSDPRSVKARDFGLPRIAIPQAPPVTLQQAEAPPAPVEEALPPTSPVKEAKQEAPLAEKATEQAEQETEEEEEEEEEKEEDEEPHEFRCENCGYTLFPARGREGKFFPDDYECLMCKAPKESFFDMSDLSDPRTIKALEAEGYEIVTEDEIAEEEKAEADSQLPEAAAPPVSEPIPAQEAQSSSGKVAEGDSQVPEAAVAAPAAAEPIAEKVPEAAVAAPTLAEPIAQKAAVAAPPGKQKDELRPSVDDWVAFRKYPAPPVHQLSRRQGYEDVNAGKDSPPSEANMPSSPLETKVPSPSFSPPADEDKAKASDDVGEAVEPDGLDAFSDVFGEAEKPEVAAPAAEAAAAKAAEAKAAAEAQAAAKKAAEEKAAAEAQAKRKADEGAAKKAAEEKAAAEAAANKKVEEDGLSDLERAAAMFAKKAAKKAGKPTPTMDFVAPAKTKLQETKKTPAARAPAPSPPTPAEAKTEIKERVKSPAQSPKEGAADFDPLENDLL